MKHKFNRINNSTNFNKNHISYFLLLNFWSKSKSVIKWKKESLTRLTLTLLQRGEYTSPGTEKPEFLKQCEERRTYHSSEISFHLKLYWIPKISWAVNELFYRHITDQMVEECFIFIFLFFSFFIIFYILIIFKHINF